jgi:hypothetical protein
MSAPAYGTQSVYEGNLELMPLLRDLPLVRQLTASAAGATPITAPAARRRHGAWGWNGSPRRG